MNQFPWTKKPLPLRAVAQEHVLDAGARRHTVLAALDLSLQDSSSRESAGLPDCQRFYVVLVVIGTSMASRATTIPSLRM